MRMYLKTLMASAFVVAMFAGINVGEASTSGTNKVTIMHVQRGCHILARGTTRAVKLTVGTRRLGSVAVTNMDIDGHKVIEVSGPTRFSSRALGMNGRTVFTFKRKGTYVFRTKTFDIGMPEMKTIGPDNVLRLTVVVK